MNKADGGHRKFILVEMMDYADSITAERVKRVIKGYLIMDSMERQEFMKIVDEAQNTMK